MSDKTDALIDKNEWAMTTPLADALRAEIAAIEAERNAARADTTRAMQTLCRAVGVSEEPDESGWPQLLEGIAALRARIAELEARLTPVKFSERKPEAGQKGTPWIPDPLESDDVYLRLHYPCWLPMPPAPEVV